MTLILQNVLLSAADGLVQSGSQIWFHFQKYPWDLSRAELNPGTGEHRRHIEARLTQGLAESTGARVLSGTYHLGISPHIYSYYHLLTDLLPHLIESPQYPILVPEFMPASFTDFLDGLLARMYKEESKLGELLDPIADKIIVAAALILLVMDGTIKNYEVVAAIIILTREILISGLREFLAKGKIKLPVSNLAKLKTFLQMFSISILLTGETGNKIINFQDYNAQTIGIILLWFSACLTLYTGYDYLRKGIDHAISEDEKN